VTRIDLTIHALAPIAHNQMGADTGNVTTFRRMQRVVGGRLIRVPVISAGALRGVVRRALWRETFAACGLSRSVVGGPWDRLYAALANGGTIEAAETRVVPDAIRARRAALPVLSLLGSALYSSHMAGRLKLTHAWLDCSELGSGGLSMHDLVTEITTVRHHDAEEQDPDVSGVGPMPTTAEVVVQGASLQAASSVTGDLEASAWAHGLDLVEYVGGKSGQGNGLVRIDHTSNGAAYVAWLAEHRDEVRAALLKLAQDLGGKREKKGKKPKAAEPAEVAEQLGDGYEGSGQKDLF